MTISEFTLWDTVLGALRLVHPTGLSSGSLEATRQRSTVDDDNSMRVPVRIEIWVFENFRRRSFLRTLSFGEEDVASFSHALVLEKDRYVLFKMQTFSNGRHAIHSVDIIDAVRLSKVCKPMAKGSAQI